MEYAICLAIQLGFSDIPTTRDSQPLLVQPVWVRSLAVIFFQLVARHRQAAVMRRAGVFIRSEWLDAGFGFQPGTDLPKAGKIAVLRRAPVSTQELLFVSLYLAVSLLVSDWRPPKRGTQKA